MVKSVRTVLDYVRGTGHRPKSRIELFPLLDGILAGQGEVILLIVPPGTQATGSHKAGAEEDSDKYTYLICIFVMSSEPKERGVRVIYFVSSTCTIVISHVQGITCRCHLLPLLLVLCLCACVKCEGWRIVEHIWSS